MELKMILLGGKYHPNPSNQCIETLFKQRIFLEFGAAFVVFSAALTELPGAVVWAIFFFGMLTLVSLKRQRLLVLALASTLQDVVRTTAAKRYRTVYMLVICGVLAGLGFIFIMPVGSHILLVLDLYVIGWPALFIVLLECIATTWIYGHPSLLHCGKRFCGDVKSLMQFKISKFWRVMWCIVTPITALVVLLFTILFDDVVEYNGVDFTFQARMIGWSLVTVVVGPTVVYGAYVLVSQRLLQHQKEQQITAVAAASGPTCKPPHWHVLSQRRKGSITPAPKILVVKSEERAAAQIPYGFVLTPQKDKSVPRPTSRTLTPHISQLLNPSPGGNKSPIATPKVLLPTPVEALEGVCEDLESPEIDEMYLSPPTPCDSYTEMQTSHFVTQPEAPSTSSSPRGDVSSI